MDETFSSADTGDGIIGESIDDAVQNVTAPLSQYLSQPVLKIISLALIVIVGLIILKIILHVVRRALNRSSLDDVLHSFIISCIKVVYIIMLIMTVAGYMGIPMTPFITVMGACGAAVALALKDSLGNFAGGILILISRPFKKGDFVECSGYTGRVQEINLLYSTLDAAGKTITIPNGLIANQTLVNLSNNDKRKLDCAFGISYDSDIDKAKEIIRRVIEDAPYFDAVNTPPAIGVTEHADSAVIINAYVWCSNDDYYDARYYLMEGVKKAFDKEGIEIPFPQVTVHRAWENVEKPNKAEMPAKPEKAEMPEKTGTA